MAVSPNILAMDTALNNCSAAVYAGGKIFSETQPMMQGHAEHLLPMVERVLKKAGIGYDDLNAIVTTVGPGAFTGLRIGLSAARALALALDVPLHGITTTQLLALQQVKEKPAPVAVILETKRQDFYFQSFDANGKAISEATALASEEIQIDGFVLIGDGVARLTGKPGALDIPDAGFMAEVFTKNPGVFTAGAEPVYLRGADVTASKRQNRVFEGTTGLK